MRTTVDAGTATPGLRIYLHPDNTISLHAIADALKSLDSSMRRAVRPKMEQAGRLVLQEAAMRASAFSQRIPHSLTLKVSWAGARPGVLVLADAKKAPHSRVYEGMVADSWRHPVFESRHSSRRIPWVTQHAIPYLRPAVHATGAEFVELVMQAVDEVLADAGFD